MEHMTEEYGQKVNYLVMNTADFWPLKAALAVIGVEIRRTQEYAGTVTVQMRNVYRDNLRMYGGRMAADVLAMSDHEAENSAWHR